MNKDGDRPVIAITGAAKNTGFAIARKFAEEGYDVCITSRSQDEADSAAKAIMDDFPDATVIGYKMETADVSQIRDVFNRIKKRFSRLDVFVANATATGYNQNILNSTEEDYDFIMASNTKGYFFCSQEAARIMVERKKGNIILIGSVHSKGAIPNRILYGLSKCAIDGLHRTIACELAKYNIRCNCLIAGAVWNNRWDGMTEEDYAARRSNWPLGIEGYPEDIADAAYYLGTDLSAKVTGTDLVVDSGVTASLLKYDKDWDKV